MTIERDTQSKDRIKEWREWSTFILSFITVIAIPLGVLILNNQRLEIEREVAQSYITRSGYAEDRSRMDQDRLDMAKHIGEIQGKLDSVLLEQVRVNDNINLLKEQVHLKLTDH